MTDADTAALEQLTELEADSPVLVEGLPGHGLVASIAVDHLTRQLGLEHHGNVHSDAFPPAITFEDGLVRDPVRVYAGVSPDVLTLKSDLAIPPTAFRPLSRCVLNDLSSEFQRGIFLAGAPAGSEDEVGEVNGVATTSALRDELEAGGIDLGVEPGLVGGVTGALIRECYHEGVPAVVLIVKAHPYLPDPKAARSVIENALEPLVDFDIDTEELREQGDEIKRRMEQIAEQYRRTAEERPAQDETAARMYQ
jgi:uncharacterized protein